MAKKYYAVKYGKKPGIYFSWDVCKEQVHGFSGAVYKSFQTEAEAREFMGEGEKQEREKQEREIRDKQSDVHAKVEAYVDGSYHSDTNEFSYGMIILQNGEEKKFSKKYQDEELAAMHNVAGEIKGAEAAMRYAVEHGLKSIIIYHDYEGIAKWCLGEWNTNKEGTKAYKAYYESIKEQVEISFVKVAGHSNNKYNDIADALAKQALGMKTSFQEMNLKEKE